MSDRPKGALEVLNLGLLRRLLYLMPLYQLFCLARPQLPKDKLADTIRRIGQAIFSQKGLLVDLQHYGDRPLAKQVRQPGAAYNFVSPRWNVSLLLV